MSFESLNTIYNKQNKESLDGANAYGLVAMLSMNPNNWGALKIIDKYMYYLNNDNLVTLLYFLIPKQTKKMYYKYIKPNEKGSILDLIHSKIKKHLGYSDREYSYVKTYIDKKVLDNIEIWKNRLAIGGKNGLKKSTK